MVDHIGQQLGNYRITAEINSGSFGSVYQAEHIHLKGKVVAIKFLYTYLGSQADREQFEQEAQFLVQLEHPFILPLIDFGFSEGQPYLITRYAAGGSLRQMLKQQRVLPIPQALTLLQQVGQALHYAHQEKIVHRDLKPENILFNERGEALLADFGIAVMLSTASMKHVDATGTPSYMAPEQFRGEISKEGDQYALGCIAYELLTGQIVFNAPDFISMGFKHATESPIAPSQLNPDLPPALEKAILKALAKQRADRYADVSAFLTALREPVTQPTILPVSTIKIFYCYAPEDSDLQMQLAAHLSPLRKIRHITTWFDRNILAGADQEQEIAAHLDAANIILILVSADFFGSDYWYNIAMRRALQRHQDGTARVIPILLRPTLWEDTPIGTLPVLPTGRKAVTLWDNRDEAWREVAQGIRNEVRKLLPAPILSPQETGILYPESLDQPGPSPIVLPPPVHLPQEARVLPPAQLNQPGPLKNTLALPQDSLICPKCQHINRPGAKYCVNDGQPLTLGISVQSRSDVLRASPIPSQGTRTLRAVAFCTLQGHISSVHCVAWSPGGKYLASAGSDKKVFVWEVRTGQHISLYSEHSDEVLCVAWSPDGRHIASGSRDGTVHIWEAVKARSVFVYHPQHRSDIPFWIQAVAWSPQPGDQRIASSSGSSVDGIQIWSAFTGQVLLTYREHPDVIRSLAWSSNGKNVASGGGRKIHVWDAATGNCMLAYRGHAKAISDMAWSPDNQRIASCGDKAVQIRMARDGKHTFTYKGHSSNVSTVTWSPDGKYLASTGGGTVQIWKADTGNLMEKMDISLRSAREYAAWSPKESYLALTGESNTIEIWQIS